MPNVTDPTVVGHLNSVVRPLSDRIVGLVAALESEKNRFKDVVKPLLNTHAGSDEIEDGAHDDGRVVQTKGDLVKFWAQMDVIIAQFDVQAAYDDMAKPHVNVIGL